MDSFWNRCLPIVFPLLLATEALALQRVCRLWRDRNPFAFIQHLGASFFRGLFKLASQHQQQAGSRGAITTLRHVSAAAVALQRVEVAAEEGWSERWCEAVGQLIMNHSPSLTELTFDLFPHPPPPFVMPTTGVAFGKLQRLAIDFRSLDALCAQGVVFPAAKDVHMLGRVWSIPFDHSGEEWYETMQMAAGKRLRDGMHQMFPQATTFVSDSGDVFPSQETHEQQQWTDRLTHMGLTVSKQAALDRFMSMRIPATLQCLALAVVWEFEPYFERTLLEGVSTLLGTYPTLTVCVWIASAFITATGPLASLVFNGTYESRLRVSIGHIGTDAFEWYDSLPSLQFFLGSAALDGLPWPANNCSSQWQHGGANKTLLVYGTHATWQPDALEPAVELPCVSSVRMSKPSHFQQTLPAAGLLLPALKTATHNVHESFSLTVTLQDNTQTPAVIDENAPWLSEVQLCSGQKGVESVLMSLPWSTAGSVSDLCETYPDLVQTLTHLSLRRFSQGPRLGDASTAAVLQNVRRLDLTMDKMSRSDVNSLLTSLQGVCELRMGKSLVSHVRGFFSTLDAVKAGRKVHLLEL